jgi:hypothetical protein
MNPLISSFLFGLFRHSLSSVGVWLVGNGILNQSQYEDLLIGLVTLTISVGWMAWDKWQTKAEFFTAAGTTGRVTLEEVRKQIKNGSKASPTTRADETPSVRSTFD